VGNGVGWEEKGGTNIIQVNRDRPTHVWSGLWMDLVTDIISPIAKSETLYKSLVNVCVGPKERKGGRLT
jgi:hypothetical protein